MSAATFIDCAVLIALGAALYHGDEEASTWALIVFCTANVLGTIFRARAKGDK